MLWFELIFGCWHAQIDLRILCLVLIPPLLLRLVAPFAGRGILLRQSGRATPFLFFYYYFLLFGGRVGNLLISLVFWLLTRGCGELFTLITGLLKNRKLEHRYRALLLYLSLLLLSDFDLFLLVELILLHLLFSDQILGHRFGLLLIFTVQVSQKLIDGCLFVFGLVGLCKNQGCVFLPIFLIEYHFRDI